MLSPDFQQKQLVKFPPISKKSKSLPSSSKSTPSSLDLVTAKSWMYSTPNSQYGFKVTAKRQIASLTKIMTAICVLEIAEKYKMNLKSTYFKVTQWTVSTIGTTADLQENAWVSIQDLLYGMLLPSGNDCAAVLSENMGAVLYFDKVGNKSMIEQIRSIDLTEDYESVKYYNQEFIGYMNQKCKSFKMFRTRFGNPHGLDHINNYSCCEDVLIMSKEAMKFQLLRKIVRATTHKATYKFFKDAKVSCKYICWTNTNKLLYKFEVVGIKTGVTSKAGGCLATLFNIDNQNQGYIIVLGSTSTESRFKDTIRILNWACDQAMNSVN